MDYAGIFYYIRWVNEILTAMKRFCFSAIVLMLISMMNLSARPGEIRLPAMVGDCMVLQRDVELKIWGWADPGTYVTVRFNGGYHEACTDMSGRWEVTLPPQKAGGPYMMEINEIVIRDILVGDVWLCSGQSNQETPIHRLTEKFPEINLSDNHEIRHYKVPTNNVADGTCESIPGNAVWHSGVASEVMNWTALAYFFAREAYEKTGVPQGMLVSSLGGSAIESWVSMEVMKHFPNNVKEPETVTAYDLPDEDPGEGKWNLLEWDDSEWKTMEMPGTWKENGLDVRGTVWMRKEFDLPESMDGRHAKLSMGTMVHNDRVYVNGVFVGSTGYEYPPRRYHIPSGVLRSGRNVIAVRLDAPEGNGGFVKDKPYKVVGDAAEIDLTGTWKYMVATDQDQIKTYETKQAASVPISSGLYNGMIYPLRNYKIKGVIWYQGESNVERPSEYGSLMASLIDGWRKLWNMPDMPFLLVQLPNFMEKEKHPSDCGWARIREAQLNAFKTIPNTSLAVTYDVGEWNDIHPLNKKAVAQRLFLGARKLAYGENIISSGPVYRSMKIDGDKIIITFEKTGSGLKSKDGPLKHFAIAGADRHFVWAEAVIRGNKVVVSSPEVPQPVAVRYAWSNNPEDANLCNKKGLLASPFRTDDW